MKENFWRENPNGHENFKFSSVILVKIAVVIVKNFIAKTNVENETKKENFSIKFFLPELCDVDCHFHSAQQLRCGSLVHQIAQRPFQFHVALKLPENLD